MEPKLVFADVDGTMLQYNTDEPTSHVVQATADFHEQGGLLVPVTTRSADLMRLPAARLGLRHLGVLDGGATIFDFNTGQQNAEHSCWLNPGQIRRIVSVVGKLCTLISYEEVYRSCHPAEVDIGMITRPAPSVFVVFENERETAIARALDGIGVDGRPNIYEDSTTLRCMQIVCTGVSKQASTKSLLAGPYAGMRPENIMVISDNETDDALLASMPNGACRLAMANAPVSLQEQADHVVPHVNDDGFAVALGNFMRGTYDI